MDCRHNWSGDRSGATRKAETQMTASGSALLLNNHDNVAIALADIGTGEMVDLLGSAEVDRVMAREAIPFAHKMALNDIPIGEPIRKYGAPIGFSVAVIRRGDWVHSHNLESYFMARRKETRS
jgi:SAF domain